MTVTELKCYACEKPTDETRKRRQKCMDREYHRPTGEPIAHEGTMMRECSTCHTLVR